MLRLNSFTNLYLTLSVMAYFKMCPIGLIFRVKVKIKSFSLNWIILMFAKTKVSKGNNSETNLLTCSFEQHSFIERSQNQNIIIIFPFGVNFINNYVKLFLAHKEWEVFFCQVVFGEWRTISANDAHNLASNWVV